MRRVALLFALVGCEKLAVEPKGRGAALEAIRPDFPDKQDIEVAGDDAASYQQLVDTMDGAIAAGFANIGFMDPDELSLKLPGKADAPVCARR